MKHCNCVLFADIACHLEKSYECRTFHLKNGGFGGIIGLPLQIRNIAVVKTCITYNYRGSVRSLDLILLFVFQAYPMELPWLKINNRPGQFV